MKQLLIKNYTKSILFLLFLVLTIGCEIIELGEPIDCKVGINYKIDYYSSFSIDKVIDSRCPKNVQCVWAGDVDINLEIFHKSAKIDTILNLNTPNNLPYTFYGYDWKINRVEPYPEFGQHIDQSDYIITLTITKN